MSSTSVSVLVPLPRRGTDAAATIAAIEQYLQTTGFAFRVLPVEHDLRRVVADLPEGIVIIVDAGLPYGVRAIGDAVAMIESGTEVVFGSRPGFSTSALLRWLLVPELPDPAVELKALSADAASLLFREAKLDGPNGDLEIAYLANKYGFRVEHLIVDTPMKSVARSGGIAAAMRIRLTDRRGGYRAPRRCPICYSPEVWSCAQIPDNVIRACSRCKCRYLNRIVEPDERMPVHRELRSQPVPIEPAGEETAHGRSAREKTSRRRLKTLRQHLPVRGRVLEIGVRDGNFGAAASREYEYVGIDRAQASARSARARGLEVYCSTLAGFVNTGPAFDAITLYHVFESMTDPHDALARVKDLLKPGGVILISALDTEALLYLLTEKHQAAQNFRTRVVLYSRSALIELLERSGFEIVSVAPELSYRDHKFLRHLIASRWPALAGIARATLRVLPDPLLVSSGSIRIVAKRRAGTPVNVRAIRSVEPTHAR